MWEAQMELSVPCTQLDRISVDKSSISFRSRACCVVVELFGAYREPASPRNLVTAALFFFFTVHFVFFLFENLI